MSEILLQWLWWHISKCPELRKVTLRMLLGSVFTIIRLTSSKWVEIFSVLCGHSHREVGVILVVTLKQHFGDVDWLYSFPELVKHKYELEQLARELWLCTLLLLYQFESLKELENFPWPLMLVQLLCKRVSTLSALHLVSFLTIYSVKTPIKEKLSLLSV